MTTPRVSIVLATHDGARFLPEALASVQAQTFGDWELVLVDDGSTDDTPAIVARAAADPRVRPLAGPRRERCAARNRGIAEARAAFVAFLDADDAWAPEKLARQVAALDAEPAAALCYTIARYVDATGRPLAVRRPPEPLAGRIFPALVRANRMILSSVVVRRTALDAAGGFDETMPTIGCEDWDLWLRIARRAPVAVVAEELTRYRVHGANTAEPQVLAGGLWVLDKLYADPSTPVDAGLSLAAARARLLWYHAAAAPDRRAALGLAARALAASPPSLASRPAAGALATIALPEPLERLVRRVFP